MTYVEIGESAQFEVDAFKQFARVSCSCDDNQIREFVRAAVLRVQQHADRALVPCTIEITGEGAELQLWQPTVASVTAAIDIDTGADEKAGCIVSGHTLMLPYAGRWRVTYTTVPNPSAVEALRPYVWQLAAAIYDGNTEEEAKVMQRIPIDYVVR